METYVYFLVCNNEAIYHCFDLIKSSLSILDPKFTKDMHLVLQRVENKIHVWNGQANWNRLHNVQDCKMKVPTIHRFSLYLVYLRCSWHGYANYYSETRRVVLLNRRWIRLPSSSRIHDPNSRTTKAIN